MFGINQKVTDIFNLIEGKFIKTDNFCSIDNEYDIFGCFQLYYTYNRRCYFAEMGSVRVFLKPNRTEPKKSQTEPNRTDPVFKILEPNRTEPK